MCAPGVGSESPLISRSTSSRVAFQGSQVASYAGLIRVHELNERLGLEAISAEHLSDSRHG